MQGVRVGVERFCLEVDAGFTLGAGVTDVTDRFFLRIEKSPGFLRRYQALLRSVRKHPLNAQIGRWIKVRFGLDNDGRCLDPRSRLIASYTLHKRP